MKRTLGACLALIVFWAFCVCVRADALEFSDEPTGSMNPTMRVGDVHLVERWVAPRDLHRGDIIIFHRPPHWQGPVFHRGALSQWWHVGLRDVGIGEPDDTFAKRVVGLPGERVTCKAVRGSVFIDGHLLHESYVKGGVGCDAPYDIVVPANHVWVLGDNRTDSEDSAWWDEIHHGTWGSVPYSTIIGRVGPRVYRR